MSQDLINEIMVLKKQKNAILLAHNYQAPIIQDLADFTGDSLELAHKVSKIKANLIVFAGAEFMAETAAILNPSKKVIIPSTMVKCPMAYMLSPKIITEYKTKYPNAIVALYINSTAESRAFADICITSGNAVKVISSIKEREILIGPDKNLAYYIQQKVPDKKIIPIPDNGYCYVHQKFQPSDVRRKKELYPHAEVIVHPETEPAVQDLADKVTSTAGMIIEVSHSKSKEFIIGTELGLLDRLRKEYPDKKFIPLLNEAICIQQKKITLYNLYLSLLYERYQIQIPSEISNHSRRCIERMFQLS
ncbi:quinolinate synthase NadA [Candidatus Hodarchaeum mangrovi]